MADVVYGKGEGFWQAERDLVIQGTTGAIAIQGEQGSLIRPEETRSLDMGTRRGLFAKDTAMVLEHLTQGTPLYVSLASSLYALRVADAARRSAETQQLCRLNT